MGLEVERGSGVPQLPLLMQARDELTAAVTGPPWSLHTSTEPARPIIPAGRLDTTGPVRGE